MTLQAASDDGDLQRLTDSFHLNLTALGLLAFVVGLFIAHAAIGLALEQRRSLIRTLRACGISLRTVLTGLALELGGFAVLGGLAGVVSGYLLAGLLLPDFAASVRGLYGAQVAGQLNLSPQWWLAGVAVSVLGALLAGLAVCCAPLACRCWPWHNPRPGVWHNEQGCGDRPLLRGFWVCLRWAAGNGATACPAPLRCWPHYCWPPRCCYRPCWKRRSAPWRGSADDRCRSGSSLTAASNCRH